MATKFRLKRNISTDAVEVVKVQLDSSGNVLNPAHLYYANGDILDETGAVVASPEYADFAAALTASATCSHVASSNDIEVLEDANGVPYSGIFDPATGALTGAVGFDGTVYTGNLSDLNEIGDRDVEYGATLSYCIDGVEWKSQTVSVFEADHVDGAVPLSSSTIFSTAQEGSETTTDPRTSSSGSWEILVDSEFTSVNDGNVVTSAVQFALQQGNNAGVDIFFSHTVGVGEDLATAAANYATTLGVPASAVTASFPNTLQILFTVDEATAAPIIDVDGDGVITSGGLNADQVFNQTEFMDGTPLVYSAGTGPSSVTFGACEAVIIPDPIVEWVDGCDCVEGTPPTSSGSTITAILDDGSGVGLFDVSGNVTASWVGVNIEFTDSSDNTLIGGGGNNSATNDVVNGDFTDLSNMEAWINASLSSGTASANWNNGSNTLQIQFTETAPEFTASLGAVVDKIFETGIAGPPTQVGGPLVVNPPTASGEDVCTEISKRLVYKFDAACVLSATPSQVDYYLQDRETSHTLTGTFGECPEPDESEWVEGAC